MTTQLTLLETTHTHTPPLITARANLAKAQAAFQKADRLVECQGVEALPEYNDAAKNLKQAQEQVNRWERAQLLIEATKPQTTNL